MRSAAYSERRFFHSSCQLASSILQYILAHGRACEAVSEWREPGSPVPEGCRLPDDQNEPVVRKVGDRVVLEPIDAWPDAFGACIGALEP